MGTLQWNHSLTNIHDTQAHCQACEQILSVSPALTGSIQNVFFDIECKSEFPLEKLRIEDLQQTFGEARYSSICSHKLNT